MKNTITICVVLVLLMSSCLEEPGIYRLLPDEDAAAIPYRVGDQLSMINQDGDTINFIVTYDETEVYDGYDDWDYSDDTKTSIEPLPWCYGRTVQLRSYADNVRLAFIVLLDKRFVFRWDNWGLPCMLDGETQTISVNGATYENVFVRQEYNAETGEPLYQWYYCESVGLIAVRRGDLSLTLVNKNK